MMSSRIDILSMVFAPVAAKHKHRDAARTSVAEDEVKDIEVLGAEDVPVAAVAVAIAVHDGGGRGGEHEHVNALGHIAPAHQAPLDQAQRKGFERARQAIDRQLHAPRLFLHQRRQAAWGRKSDYLTLERHACWSRIICFNLWDTAVTGIR